MGIEISVKQKEAKTLKFTITSGGSPLNVSSATLLFGVKKTKADAIYTIQKLDASFDKSQAANGIVKVPISSADLNINEGTYIGELKTSFSSENVDKSADIIIKINKAVTD